MRAVSPSPVPVPTAELILEPVARELVVVKLSSWPLPQEPSKLLDTLAAIDMIGFQLNLASGLT